jgi:uncharacterized protein YggE
MSPQLFFEVAMLRIYFLIIVLLAAHHTNAPSLRAQTTAPPEIVATASGSATFNPDRATVVIEVRTEASTPQEASGRNAPIMTAVLAALRRIGHRSENISTRGYTVQPTYRYESGGPIPTGYAAYNAVTVRLEGGVQRVGETLDTALAAGATRVGSVRFESSQFERTRRQALEQAVINARQDAEVMARAAGGTLGELVSISTNIEPYREGGYVASVAAVAPPPFARGETPINAGEQTVMVSVEGRWRFVKR